MTRSQKKRIKNLKIAEAKGLDRQAKRIKVIALVWTNKLTKQVNPEKHLFGRLCLCRTCQYPYCLCYDGTIQFCINCFYRRGCQKITEPIEPLLDRECRDCSLQRKEIQNDG